MILDRLEGKEGLSPIYLHALVFWDEKHKKQVLGPMSKYQYRVYRKDGKPCPEAEGGILSAKQCRTSLKYAEEARGCFGVAIKMKEENNYEGVKCKPSSSPSCSQCVRFNFR